MAEPTLNEIIQAAVQAGMAAVAGGSGKNSDTINRGVIKLTDVGAKQLLDSIMADIQFTGKLSKEDLTNFVEIYNKAANAQLETVTRIVREQLPKDANTKDIEKTVSTVVQTTSPSYFDPKQFTKDYLWAKVNFADEKTLGAKALDALTTARQIARAFNLSTVSEIEIQDAAKRIATGKITSENYKTELAAKAAVEYPQLTDRLKNTPGATVRSLYNPVLKAVADTWEVEIESLDLNDPFIDKLIRPDGVIGKMPSATAGEAKQAALLHANADKAPTQIVNARNAATSWAKAMGF